MIILTVAERKIHRHVPAYVYIISGQEGFTPVCAHKELHLQQAISCIVASQCDIVFASN